MANDYKGIFITLEGGEAGGKTTQINYIKDYLTEQGLETIITREPGSTRIGKKIRGILLDLEIKDMDYRAELLLFAADRAQHFNELIIPALESGKAVISDRCYDSTKAYQGYGRGIDLNLINDFRITATYNVETDITFVLDLPVKTAFERKNKMKDLEFGKLDRIEQEKFEFHERIRDGFLEIAKQEPYRVKVIDASKNIEEVRDQIIPYVHKLILDYY